MADDDDLDLNKVINPEGHKRVRVTIEVLDHYLVGGGSAKSDQVVIEMSRPWDGTDKDRADFCRFLADHGRGEVTPSSAEDIRRIMSDHNV